MRLKVVYLRSAEADLKEIKRYVVKNFGEDAWQASYSKIKEAVSLIAGHPNGGKVPDELARLNFYHFRQVLGGKNRIIYEVRGDTAYIHVVCDTRKDFKSLVMRRILGTI